MPDGLSPVMVLPHFSGSGTPHCDVDSRGAIVGLGLSTTRHDIAKAILEALCFELRVNCQRMRDAGIRHDELVAVGGGARSETWLQMKADVMGCPIRTLTVRESACLGAAILAGTACGMYGSVDEGVEMTVKTSRVVEPDSDRMKAYDGRFETYQQLHPSLRQLNAHL
jgi:sugar (pentulose or hexulose) kinase